VKRIVTGAGAAIVVITTVIAAERVDQDAVWRIRQEATARSQILATTQILTDRYGPRLTGSPNVKSAAEWALEQMGSWGLQNGHLEPWDWDHPGWLNERLSAHIFAPVKDPLVGEVLAWTPGTSGPVRAEAVQITMPQQPTKAQLTEHLAALQDKVKGKIVLVGAHQAIPESFNEPPERRDDQEVLRALQAPPSSGRGQGPAARPRSDRLTGTQIAAQVYEFLRSSGALVRVSDAARGQGQIRAFANSTYDPDRAIPTVVLRNEDYGRISRLLAGGHRVELEFDIVNRLYPEGRTGYNAIAEIPGETDEVVMLGAHLDSWHAATGATDNAIGCAVVMEAARILKTMSVKPRRTIRVALWSGEEQGLVGSRAYVREHFGTFEQPKAAFHSLSAYLNVDYGTGRIRYFTIFGPPASVEVIADAVAPLKDLGVFGANATRTRRVGFSDHSAFTEAGLPGIGDIHDPIHYESHTWHSNLDTYERIVEEDAIKSAIAVAVTVYHLATRPERLPRFADSDMPPVPQR
jgi:carboxypeptidase Q